MNHDQRVLLATKLISKSFFSISTCLVPVGTLGVDVFRRLPVIFFSLGICNFQLLEEFLLFSHKSVDFEKQTTPINVAYRLNISGTLKLYNRIGMI